jgi:hypothetical protein
MEKRASNPLFDLPVVMMQLTMSSWETVVRRAAVIAQAHTQLLNISVWQLRK